MCMIEDLLESHRAKALSSKKEALSPKEKECMYVCSSVMSVLGKVGFAQGSRRGWDRDAKASHSSNDILLLPPLATVYSGPLVGLCIVVNSNDASSCHGIPYP